MFIGRFLFAASSRSMDRARPPFHELEIIETTLVYSVRSNFPTRCVLVWIPPRVRASDLSCSKHGSRSTMRGTASPLRRCPMKVLDLVRSRHEVFSVQEDATIHE